MDGGAIGYTFDTTQLQVFLAMIENVTNPPLQQRLGRGTNTSSTLKLLFQPKPGTKSNIPTIAQLTGYSERTVGRAMEADVEPAAISEIYPAGVTRSKRSPRTR